MKEQTISRSYAKAIYLLGKENNVDAAAELTKLTEVINAANELETLLFIDVFTPEEKTSVIKEVFSKLGTNNLVCNFVYFLINEKRMNLLPLVYKELIILDDHDKGFLRGVIEGRADSVDSEFEAKMVKYLEGKIGSKTKLSYQKNEDITAGFRVTVEDLQVDASINYQLDKLKTSILSSQ